MEKSPRNIYLPYSRKYCINPGLDFLQKILEWHSASSSNSKCNALPDIPVQYKCQHGHPGGILSYSTIARASLQASKSLQKLCSRMPKSECQMDCVCCPYRLTWERGYFRKWEQNLQPFTAASERC